MTCFHYTASGSIKWKMQMLALVVSRILESSKILGSINFCGNRCFHNAFLEERIRSKMGSMIHEKCGTPFRVISYKGMVFRQFSKYELVGPPTCFQENLLLHVTS